MKSASQTFNPHTLEHDGSRYSRLKDAAESRALPKQATFDRLHGYSYVKHDLKRSLEREQERI